MPQLGGRPFQSKRTSHGAVRVGLTAPSPINVHSKWHNLNPGCMSKFERHLDGHRGARRARHCDHATARKQCKRVQQICVIATKPSAVLRKLFRAFLRQVRSSGGHATMVEDQPVFFCDFSVYFRP